MKLKNTRASMKNHYLRIKEKQAPKTFFLSKPSKQTIVPLAIDNER